MMNNINILVAEDFEFNQLIIKQLLTEIGSKFIIVANGEEAVLQLSMQPFDIVFMDIEMPVMDGVEAIRLIKSSYSDLFKQIPIIAFTSHHDSSKINELREEGFVDFVHKPFKKEEIVDLINRYVLDQGGTANMHTNTSEAEGEIPKRAYDLTNIRAFSDGDEVFVVKMLAYFITNAPAVIQNMKQNWMSGNWSELKMEAHKFSSELGLLGISEMMTLAEQIEKGAELPRQKEQLLSDIGLMEKLGTEIINQIKSDFNI